MIPCIVIHPDGSVERSEHEKGYPGSNVDPGFLSEERINSLINLDPTYKDLLMVRTELFYFAASKLQRLLNMRATRLLRKYNPSKTTETVYGTAVLFDDLDDEETFSAENVPDPEGFVQNLLEK